MINDRLLVLHHETEYYPLESSLGNTVYNFLKLCIHYVFNFVIQYGNGIYANNKFNQLIISNQISASESAASDGSRLILSSIQYLVWFGMKVAQVCVISCHFVWRGNRTNSSYINHFINDQRYIMDWLTVRYLFLFTKLKNSMHTWNTAAMVIGEGRDE